MALIARIENATRILGKPGDWDQDKGTHCSALAVRDVNTEYGQFMVSAWEFTPDELQQLTQGATVKLWIRGRAHPVVALTVGAIENVKLEK